MVFEIHFKTPDALCEVLKDLDEEEQEIAKSVCSKWVRYGENITVIVDTEKETCEVKKR